MPNRWPGPKTFWDVMKPHGKSSLPHKGNRDSAEIMGMDYDEAKNWPKNTANLRGSERETTNRHGANFEVSGSGGNNTEADDASGHGGRGNFLIKT